MDMGAGILPFTAGAARKGMPTGSSEFLAEALASVGVGAWHFDTLTGLITRDAVASRILGLEEAPQTSNDLGPIHPEDQARVRDELEKSLRDGSQYHVQFRVVRADGEIRWLYAAASPPKSGGRQAGGLVGIVADITKRKAADEALRQAEERHRLINRATADLIYEWDIRTGELSWNDALATCLGHSPEVLSSAAALNQKIHQEDRVRIGVLVRRAINGGDVEFASELRFQRADGSYADVHTRVHVIRDALGRAVRLVGTMQDLSERKSLDAALRESEAVNRSIVEASTDVIKLLDLEGRLLFMNGSGADALELHDPTLHYGALWAPLWPLRARALAREAVAIAARGGIGRFSEACPTARGQNKWWDVVVSPVWGDGETPTKLVAISRDVTDRKQIEERLVRAATLDPLTHLPNRAYFQETLNTAGARMRDDGIKLGLLLLDLDDFKQVNDTLGHDAGDALLKTFAARLTKACPTQATVARLGGDEFGVVIEGISDPAELSDHARAILKSLRTPFTHDGRVLDCRATIGAALFPDHGSTPEETLKSADIALYAAKAVQRGGFETFKDSHRAAVRDRISMVSLARSAVSEGRVTPYYQPKVLIADRSICGFEALLRWHHPQHGIQLPVTIAAAFEDIEVASAISDNIIDQVVADMRGWLDGGHPFGHIAVNAGAAELRRDDYAESVLERLERAGVPTSCLQLEVTEAVFLGRGAEHVDRALKLLDAAGVMISLDDFGTGHASLQHLKQFPVHEMKIDRSFVANMDAQADDAAIIEAVLNLGRSLKIRVVAEGIESATQERRLRDLGCEYGQGFLYCEAVSASAVPLLLTSGHDKSVNPLAASR